MILQFNKFSITSLMKLVSFFSINTKAFIVYTMLGWTFAPIVEFINKYVYNDWEFLKFLFVITSVDTMLGFVKAIKKKQVSSKGFSMIFNKIIIYSAALIATHTLVHFTIDNQAQVVFGWFDSVVFSAIIIRET